MTFTAEVSSVSNQGRNRNSPHSAEFHPGRNSWNSGLSQAHGTDQTESQLCSPAWLDTGYVDQGGLKLIEMPPEC